MRQAKAMDFTETPGRNPPEKTSSGWQSTSVIPLTILAGGLAAWLAGATTDVPRAELVAQPLFIAAWVLFVVGVYERLPRGVAPSRGDGSGGPERSASWSEKTRVAGLVALLLPVLIVTETWIKWTTNDVLYDTEFTLPVFRGLLRGVFEQVVTPGQPAFGVDPVTGSPLLHQLSAFARLLGFVEETQPYAAAAASPQIGDVIWAVVATSIGTGRLRRTMPLLARAYRITGLVAATAPPFTMIYFLIFGGDGVNGWYSVFGSLLGQVDDGTWLPMWIRLTGAGIFFLLPPLIVGWQLRADMDALGTRPRSIGDRHLVTPPPGDAPEEARTKIVVVGSFVGAMLVLWASNVTFGQPYSWSAQSVWLVLWFAYLEWVYRALWRLTPEGETQVGTGRPGPSTWRWRTIAPAILLALTVTNLVVQVGGQWLVASANLETTMLDLQFFGWFLGQVKTPPSVTLPPAAIGMALLGNAAWASVLLWLGSALPSRRGDSRVAQLLRLGALQAATTPLVLAQYLVLSVLTKVERHRLSGHLPPVDLWGTWSYVMGRPIEGAVPRYQAAPEWLVLATLLFGVIAMPFGFFALRLRIERRLCAAHDAQLPNYPSPATAQNCSIVHPGDAPSPEGP